MHITFETIEGGRHAIVVEDAGERRRTDVVVSGDILDKGRPLWFWGTDLSGVMLRDRLIAFLEQELKSDGN